MIAPETSIWFQAGRAGRDYVTPNDVLAAIAAGAMVCALWGEVLEAIAHDAVIDALACAHAATRGRR